ncbi:MAG: hypothetical protein CL844_01030 [Crocinitomicaceae bacterium]|nr:hypothetical protein [Crocinitomicaceae bacterium]|tara:strand:+ start:40838 stop:41455 length:618 start_codon:yes stop_codon:yes gene_type:complete
MNKSLLIFYLFTSIFSFGQTFSKISNVTKIESKLNEKLKSFSSISCRFIETINSSMYNSPKKNEGKIYYKKINKIRWEYLSPKKEIILIDGEKIKIKRNNKIIKTKPNIRMFKKMQFLIIELLNGDFINNKNYIKNYYENKLFYKISITSNRLSKYISSIEILFNKKNLQPNSIKIIQTNTDQIEYRLSTIIINKEISNAKFTKF